MQAVQSEIDQLKTRAGEIFDRYAEARHAAEPIDITLRADAIIAAGFLAIQESQTADWAPIYDHELQLRNIDAQLTARTSRQRQNMWRFAMGLRGVEAARLLSGNDS